MRQDFHKVVIERPRSGSRSRNLKTGWSTMQYDRDSEYPFPKTQSSSWNWNPDRKWFSDRLGPLKRYLQAQVGRPWSKVEGEFLHALDVRTVIGRHLWDHARAMVETECEIGRDGRPRSLRGYPVRDLYAHPRTGILLKAKPERIDEARARRTRLDEATEVRIDARTRAEKVDGLWFLFVATGRTEEAVEVRLLPGGKKVAVHVERPLVLKKQANKAEIRRIRAALEAADPR